ncbi:hypothetical protein [Pelagibius sp.]|uniref:hypothetical protein n=1 Tax=Pelagibius sp. TaxID=1931238 RepID=UPI002616435A|nr:hypothetical protein [Pelagibius sp.]
MPKGSLVLAVMAVALAACQTTGQETAQVAAQQVVFNEPVANTGNYQVFCPDQSLDAVARFFKQPKELSGYLASGSYFSSRSESNVTIKDSSITHQAPKIAAVYFFKEGTDKGRDGVFILAKGFFDEQNRGRWEPMIAVDPRALEGDACYTLNS